MIKLRFFGGANEVGASCTLIEIAGCRILVDAGIRMGPGKNSKRPDLGALDKPDALLLTHAHSDHTGALPVLVKENRLPEKVYCTHATKDITQVLLYDAVRREERESPGLPNDVREALSRMELVRYMEPVQICDGVKATWIRAGHILGAAMIYIQGKRESILLTGDVSVADQLTIPGMVIPEWCRPDVMVMESTYGNRLHKDRAQQEAALVRDVVEVVKAGGKVLIPAFAVARSQEVIQLLKDPMEQKQIPVYVDGMVQKVNDVYSRYVDDLSPSLQCKAKDGEDIFYSAFVKRVDSKGRRDRILSGPPCCIVASSGMLNGGVSKNYYAKRLAGDPKNLIAFTGYQAEGTPGRKLQDERVLNLDGQEVSVECDVKQYSLSAHADQKELTELVEKLRPRTCFFVHGDDSARKKLAESVRERSPVVDVQLPENGGEYTYTQRTGIADGRQLRLNKLSEVYAYLMEREAKGPFRLRELAEIWFGTEWTTLKEEKLFGLLLALDWQTLFERDHRSPDLFHLRRTV